MEIFYSVFEKFVLIKIIKEPQILFKNEK